MTDFSRIRFIWFSGTGNTLLIVKKMKGVFESVRKILTDKGYFPLGAREFLMPNNLFPGHIKKARNTATVARSLAKAESFARAILEGKASWGRIPLLSDMMGSFSKNEGTWKFLRRGYILEVDKEACSRCGLCFRLCPAGNISGDKVPEFGNQCYICMRCISFCPTGAIFARKAHFHSRSRDAEYYRAVSARDLLDD